MSGNAIPVLSARQFSRFDLVNLQRLSASSVGLESVDGTAFDGLTNLIEMDLAENLLTEVGEGGSESVSRSVSEEERLSRLSQSRLGGRPREGGREGEGEGWGGYNDGMGLPISAN